jgi:hypothetical protein
MKMPRKVVHPAESGDDQDEIAGYAEKQAPSEREICCSLRTLIDAALPKATSKVWHGSPVWFIDDNPVVGYSVNKKGVALLFWNGQAFDTPGLSPVGKYRAAQAVFAEPDAVNVKLIQRWLKSARSNVFDSRAFFKRKAK